MSPEMERAFWAGDTEKLYQMAPCRCCCEDHTFSDCPARQWHGCRGSNSEELTQEDEESWLRLYEAQGMTREEFYR